MLADVASTFIGLFVREAIYYEAAGFYLHQFLKFSRQRYRKDTEWLLQNVGISIRPTLEIAKFILDRINAQMTAVGHLRENDRDFGKGELTDSLLIAKEDVRKKFGGKSDAFFTKFVTPITEANKEFGDVPVDVEKLR